MKKAKQLSSLGNAQNSVAIIITFYLPNRFGQETTNGRFGLQVQLPPAHLSTTHCGDFTLSL